LVDVGKKALEVKERATSRTVAFISPDPDGIKNCWIEENLNGQVTLKFILPMNSSKWEFIDDKYSIIADGHEFVLVGKEEERDDSGKLLSNVQFEESYIELGGIYTPYITVEILRADAFTVLTQLLAPTGWTVGTVDVLGTHDLETEKLSCLANLWEVQKIWGGYLKFNSLQKTVFLVVNPGIERPVHIRYGKNLKSIKRETDTNIVNRLIPYGKDHLDIRSVNNNVIYVEDFTYIREKLKLLPTDPVPSWAIKEGNYDRQDIEDPQELKDAALKEVAKTSRPKVNYQVKMVDLRYVTGYEGEVFGVGDVVTIYDEEFLAIDVKQMVIKNRYNFFEREQAELEIGDPLENWAEKLASMDVAQRIVNEQVAPNPGLKNLLKGLLVGEATQILGSNGKIQWTDNGFKIIETDQAGNPTGGEIVLTPQGMLLKDPNGNEYDTAVSARGIMASKIIVNALYALATEDGYTKLMADGLHVYDNSTPNPKKRLHAGQYATGKFGLQVIAKDGQTVVLDEDGILQTWQDGRADNVDKDNPLRLYVYLPAETKSIKKALMRFRLLAFRAYEKAISSASDTTSTQTSSSGGGTTQTSSDDVYNLYSAFVPDAMSWEGDHAHSGSTSWTIPTIAGSDHYHDYRNMGAAGGHSHTIDAHHRHDITIPSHSHTVTVTVPGHTHVIGFGIYTGQTPPNVTVKVNGVQVGGTYATDQSAIDIASKMNVGQWNIIEITPGTDTSNTDGLGRVDAAVFVQALMGV